MIFVPCNRMACTYIPGPGLAPLTVTEHGVHHPHIHPAHTMLTHRWSTQLPRSDGSSMRQSHYHIIKGQRYTSTTIHGYQSSTQVQCKFLSGFLLKCQLQLLIKFTLWITAPEGFKFLCSVKMLKHRFLSPSLVNRSNHSFVFAFVLQSYKHNWYANICQPAGE